MAYKPYDRVIARWNLRPDKHRGGAVVEGSVGIIAEIDPDEDPTDASAFYTVLFVDDGTRRLEVSEKELRPFPTKPRSAWSVVGWIALGFAVGWVVYYTLLVNQGVIPEPAPPPTVNALLGL